jgi:hypothetical protein
LASLFCISSFVFSSYSWTISFVNIDASCKGKGIHTYTHWAERWHFTQAWKNFWRLVVHWEVCVKARKFRAL